MLHDPFNRSRLPADLADAAQRERDREQRVEWIDQVAQQLLDDPEPARAFVGGALSAFLRDGGDLERLLGIKPRRGSKRTAAQIWNRLQSRR